MPNRRSLVGASAAKALLEAIKKAPHDWCFYKLNDHVYCYLRRTEGGNLILRLSEHQAFRHEVYSREAAHTIRTKDPAKSINGFVTEFLFAHTEDQRARAKREELCDEAEKRVIPESWLNNPWMSRPYSYFSPSDCAILLAQVKQLPLKDQP